MLTVEELAGLPDELLKELRLTGSKKECSSARGGFARGQRRGVRGRAKAIAEKYKYWYVLNELPSGWCELKYAPSPLSGCVFIANSQSPINATQIALLRVRPPTAMKQKPCQS